MPANWQASPLPGGTLARPRGAKAPGLPLPGPSAAARGGDGPAGPERPPRDHGHPGARAADPALSCTRAPGRRRPGQTVWPCRLGRPRARSLSHGSTDLASVAVVRANARGSESDSGGAHPRRLASPQRPPPTGQPPTGQLATVMAVGSGWATGRGNRNGRKSGIGHWALGPGQLHGGSPQAPGNAPARAPPRRRTPRRNRSIPRHHHVPPRSIRPTGTTIAHGRFGTTFAAPTARSPLQAPGAAGPVDGEVCLTNLAKDRADAQRLVATRLLDRLHDPLGHFSRLQRIYPRAR